MDLSSPPNRRIKPLVLRVVLSHFYRMLERYPSKSAETPRMRKTAAPQGIVLSGDRLFEFSSLISRWQVATRVAKSMGFKGEFRQWEDLLRIGD